MNHSPRLSSGQYSHSLVDTETRNESLNLSGAIVGIHTTLTGRRKLDSLSELAGSLLSDEL
jgi:hypothetical protein